MGSSEGFSIGSGEVCRSGPPASMRALPGSELPWGDFLEETRRGRPAVREKRCLEDWDNKRVRSGEKEDEDTNLE